MLTGLQLRRALLKYGQHTWLCATRRMTKDDACTCGFSALHDELTALNECKVCGSTNRYPHNNECVDCVRRRVRARRQREKAACT